MYTKMVFETAYEFFAACNPDRPKGDNKPIVPHSVYVVFDGEAAPQLSGDGAKKFELGPRITQAEMIEAAFQLISVKIHLT